MHGERYLTMELLENVVATLHYILCLVIHELHNWQHFIWKQLYIHKKH